MKLKLNRTKRNFPCPTCHKRFRDNFHLKIHTRTHEGHRPYACMRCRSTFRQAVHLQNHMRIHKELKPYSCPSCGAQFRQSSNLQQHMKQHKPFLNVQAVTTVVPRLISRALSWVVGRNETSNKNDSSFFQRDINATLSINMLNENSIVASLRERNLGIEELHLADWVERSRVSMSSSV